MAIQNDEVVYTRVLLEKIKEHKEMSGIPDDKRDLQVMPLSEYKTMVNREAFFFVDHNGFLRSQFSGEILAANREQLDAMIYHLQILRDKMDD
ncbi:hypothetical protein CWC46_16745 [Prodigiosinella confusarubida]|uniref:Uncharacterized protein n=1 Tax=Serratia sp. (strain ATCC 39006) TaxID=104623 RepID=A0A2I5T9T9_SERS3|nr:hypothetical protein [Serratia sp. ATCC 39006]AUH01314.1 hypothetical protein CWC46_16745 [Serratia sp. ATCC 39006]AUH05635.1 hypothetical protein Ser39006_016745 [Serratia sp. ATCC 39006]